MFILTVLCAAVISLCLYYFNTVKEFISAFNQTRKVPGPPVTNVIIGSITPLQTVPEQIFRVTREWARQFYPIYNVRVLHLVAVNILTPEDFELILSNPKHNDKSLAYTLLHNWLGTGLLTSNGRKWISRRKILTPAFHFSILQQFIDVFNDETEKLVASLKEECNKPYVKINAYITQFTLKTITETAMGTKLKFESEKEITYKKAVFDIGKILLYRLVHSWYMNNFVNLFSPYYLKERRTTKILHNFTKEVIHEREKNFQEIDLPTDTDEVYTSRRRLAMLDLLLNAKRKEGVIDDEGIREEVDTFTFEGHDTTSVALSFALMLIACHKDVQEQIFQETNAVLGDLHKKPTYNDMQEMKYLERTIKEVLRMYPSVHFISRKLGDDMVTSSGYILPKNTICHLHIYDLHHDHRVYPDPEKFDPDRFLPENCQNRHPFAYVPFSAGPRNCIGQRFAMLELKAAISGILAKFVLEPVDTPETIVLVSDIVLRTAEDIKVKFIPRL